MKCDNCNIEMIEGYISIESTFLSFLLVGLSYKHLYFKAQKNFEKKIAGNSEKKLLFIVSHAMICSLKIRNLFLLMIQYIKNVTIVIHKLKVIILLVRIVRMKLIFKIR